MEPNPMEQPDSHFELSSFLGLSEGGSTSRPRPQSHPPTPTTSAARLQQMQPTWVPELSVQQHQQSTAGVSAGTELSERQQMQPTAGNFDEQPTAGPQRFAELSVQQHVLTEMFSPHGEMRTERGVTTQSQSQFAHVRAHVSDGVVENETALSSSESSGRLALEEERRRFGFPTGSGGEPTTQGERLHGGWLRNQTSSLCQPAGIGTLGAACERLHWTGFTDGNRQSVRLPNG